MKPWASPIRNQKGVALPLALFALVMLSGLLLAFLTMSGMEPSIAANLNDVTKGRYVADAGIEYAFDLLANPATDWTNVLLNNPKVTGTNPQAVWLTAANGVGMTLPGLPATNGTFTVQARNDVCVGVGNPAGCLAADQALTGLAPDASATTDVNLALIVTATGTYNNGSRQIQVVVRRLPIPQMPGALNCAGLQCDFDMGVVSDWTNHHFHSNGLDFAQDPNNSANMVGVSGPIKYAIAVPTGNQSGTGQPFETRVESALNKHQINEMDGLAQGSNPPVAYVSRQYNGAGTSSIAGDAKLVSTVDGSGNFVSNSTSDFVNKLRAQPGVNVFQSKTGAGGVTIMNGAPIGLNSGLPVNLGTTTSPKISYFQGNPDPSNIDRVLKLTGTNSGAGILIVENGFLQIFDSFRWDGVIIITWQNAAVTFDKSVQANVYGGVILNETKKDLDTPSYELNLQKNCIHSEDAAGCGGNDLYYTKLYSSAQRVNQAQTIRSLVKMSTWREL